MSKKYKKFLLIILLMMSITTFSRFFNNADYWLVDIFSHFPVQYAFLALIIFSICLWKRFVTLAVLAVFLFIFNISAIIDFRDSIHAAEYTRTPFKVYSANLHRYNDELSQLKKEVRQIDPDILLLLEVIPDHFEELRSIMQLYPYQIEKRTFGGPEIGFVFLSKFPILSNHVTTLSNVCNFFLEAMIEVNQKPLVFYGVHAQRPDSQNYGERKNQFRWLSRRINEQTLPVIVAGDFNATPYSAIFRGLVETTSLRDSREGFGWQPSWPTFFPPLWIPIDHVMVTPDIKVHKRATGSYIGSDHYPVLVELSL